MDSCEQDFIGMFAHKALNFLPKRRTKANPLMKKVRSFIHQEITHVRFPESNARLLIVPLMGLLGQCHNLSGYLQFGTIRVLRNIGYVFTVEFPAVKVHSAIGLSRILA